MFRSTNKAAMLLILFTGASAWDPFHPFAGDCGPGNSEDDDAAAHTGSSGEPYIGYHIRTYDPTKHMNASFQRRDGSTVKHNQVIVKDVDASTTNPIEVDPANGIYGEGLNPTKGRQNYQWDATTKLWDVPSKKDCPAINPDDKNVGYPSNLVKTDKTGSYLKWEDMDFVQTMRQIGYLDSEQGVMLKNSDGSKADGYNKLSEGKDYMLLYFGADWCRDCDEFSKRFTQYYNQEIKGKQIEVVYFGHEETEDQFAAYHKTLPFPAARFDSADHELIFRLKNVLEPKMSIPCVVVIDKAGNVVTTQGVEGIRGDAHRDGKYPLSSRPDLFKDQAILPGDQNCSIDTEEQKKQLIETTDASIKTMSVEHLKTSAAKLKAQAEAAGTHLDIPADIPSLRKFMEDTSNQVIQASDAHDTEKAYIKKEQVENLPQNYHFKIDDFIRVKQSFESDPETISGDTNRVPANNVGKIVAVTASGNPDSPAAGVCEGSIELQLKDNTYARRWLLPKHFNYIEKITKEEAYREGFPLDA